MANFFEFMEKTRKHTFSNVYSGNNNASMISQQESVPIVTSENDNASMISQQESVPIVTSGKEEPITNEITSFVDEIIANLRKPIIDAFIKEFSEENITVEQLKSILPELKKQLDINSLVKDLKDKDKLKSEDPAFGRVSIEEVIENLTKASATA